MIRCRSAERGTSVSAEARISRERESFRQEPVSSAGDVSVIFKLPPPTQKKGMGQLSLELSRAQRGVVNCHLSSVGEKGGCHLVRVVAVHLPP